MIKEIAFTAYSVTNVARSVEFYEAVLGLKAAYAYEQWGEFEIGTGAFSLTTYGKPSPNGATIAFEVEDLDATLATFQAREIPIVQMVPEQPILDTPVCRMFTAQDPDGNVFIMHQRKPGHGA